MLHLVTQLCPTPCNPQTVAYQAHLSIGDSPRKNTRVGYHALLQGIFPNQRSNTGFPHCRQIRYQLSYQGSPNYEYIHLYIFIFLFLQKHVKKLRQVLIYISCL